MTRRNEAIRRSLERSRVPILPFELELAWGAIEKLSLRQKALGKELGKAMTQSSETSHDNAPAEVVTNESRNIVSSAEGILKVIRHSDLFDYSDSTEEGVTLGSIVDIRYENEPDPVRVVLTGKTRELPDRLKATLPIDEETLVLTLDSPVGQAIFDKQAGEVASFQLPNGHDAVVAIEAIEQMRLDSDTETFST